MRHSSNQSIPCAKQAPEYRLPIDTGSALVAPHTRVSAGDCIGQYRGLNVFASVSGTVGDARYLPVVNREDVEHITIIPGTTTQDVVNRLDPQRPANHERLIDLCRESGLVGMGGSGFPLHLKLAAALTNGAHTLVVNAMQCESANDSDVALLCAHASDLAEALDLLKSLLGLNEVILALPDTQKMRVADATSQLNPAPQVRYLPTNAASGEERRLIRTVTGLVVPKNCWPTDHGVLSMNLATCHALALVVAGHRPVRRIVTLDGVNQWVHFGHPIADLLAGGDHPIYHGGRSGFRVEPMVSIGPTTTSLQRIAIPTPTACIRCGRCNTSCPVDLKPQELYWYGAAGRWDDVGGAMLDACVECGACDVVCPSHLPLVDTFRAGKAEGARKAQTARLAEVAKLRFERHQRRQQRMAATETERRAQRLRNRAKRQHGSDL